MNRDRPFQMYRDRLGLYNCTQYLHILNWFHQRLTNERSHSTVRTYNRTHFWTSRAAASQLNAKRILIKLQNQESEARLYFPKSTFDRKQQEMSNNSTQSNSRLFEQRSNFNSPPSRNDRNKTQTM